MHYLLGTILLVLLSSCSSRISTVDEAYANGQPKYRGKYVLCLSNHPAYPEIIVHEKRKFGKWIYYYPDGKVKEVRQYTDNVRDCRTEVLKQGAWRYYSPEGVHYLTRQYRNDSLVYSELEVYEGEHLIGKVVKSDLSEDLVTIQQPGSGLITNASFEQYYFKPVRLINDGQDQIESLIPGWYSPDSATPDYYNAHRSVEGISHPLKLPPSSEPDNGYVGLMLHLDTAYTNLHGLPDYSECLQTKLREPLKKGQNYCFRINIRRSPNSGFSINRFGVLFSKEPVTFDYTKPPDSASISFSKELDDLAGWNVLCANYVASGGESYMTLGRFAAQSDLTVRPRSGSDSRALNMNESAYYLVDEVELFGVADHTGCGCSTPDSLAEKPDTITLFSKKIAVGDTVTLENIRFKFDSYQLDPNSFPELDRLLDYLNKVPEMNLVIIGHTDNTGSEAYNLRLSRQRAEEVETWLKDQGITPERITTKGLGNRYPLPSNGSGSELNRRVEITLTR